MEEDAGQQPVGLHGDTIWIVPVRRVEPHGRELVPFRRCQNPSGTDGPVMDPLAVCAFVESLDGPGVDRPHPVQRRVGILDTLPIQARRGQCALEERCGYSLAQATDLASAQRRRDPQRGEVGRADAWPRGPREDRPFTIGAPDEPFGRAELGVRPGTAIDELHCRPPPTLLVKEKTGPGSDKPVVARTVPVGGVLPIGGDRTGDDPRIECTEGAVVDPEPFGCPQREAVDDHIGSPGELIELLPAPDSLQIEASAALPSIPDPIPGLLRKWIAQGRLDAHDVRPVVGQEHGGHWAGHAPGQIENAQMLECSSHTTPPLHILVGPP